MGKWASSLRHGNWVVLETRLTVRNSSMRQAIMSAGVSRRRGQSAGSSQTILKRIFFHRY
jgi:hypothetical protein